MSKNNNMRGFIPSDPGDIDEIEAAASLWLARQERGLNADEQRQFDSWLGADARHREAVRWLGSAWETLDGLRVRTPGASAESDPDWLVGGRVAAARTGRRDRRWLALAAAAVFAMGVGFWCLRSPTEPAVARAVPSVIVKHERQALPDGSQVELNKDSAVTIDYTETHRRVVLVRGEAAFTVVKDPSRPFLVQAGSVVVRAVGTVFNVRLQPDAVDVLVTEGGVRIGDERVAQAGPVESFPIVVAGHRARIAGGATDARIEAVAAQEMEQMLAWRGVRLVFAGHLLSEVVEELNRHSLRRLVIGDAELGALRLGGSFRADNIDAFVRLLESSFGVTASTGDAGEIILRKR
jgi:Fe2+-dicitrate sensor, membrane component